MNTGNTAGAEVVQVYISLPPNGTTTPQFQLKGFAKVHNLQPGESEVARIMLDKYAVSFWDSPNNVWKAIGSTCVLTLSSSNDIFMKASKLLDMAFTLERVVTICV